MIAAFTGFLMGFIGSMPIVGPVSLLVFYRGMLARYQDGWMIGLGGALAEGVYCTLAVHGFSVLHDGFPFLESLTKGLGILLPLALGLYFIFARQGNTEESAVAEPPPSNWVSAFCCGLSVAALNPTLILTWSAAIALLYFIANLAFQSYDRFVFAVGVVLGDVAWFTVLLALLRHFRGRFPFLALQRVVRTIGAGLVLLSVTLAAWRMAGSI